VTRDVLVLVKCDTIFRLFVLEITTNSNFKFSQSSAATYYEGMVESIT